MALLKSLDLPGQEDDDFLLLSEGKYQQAAAQAQTWLDKPQVERLNKAVEITNLLILSQARQGLGENKKARESLERARELMEETGCWRDKNRLAETEVLLDRQGV